MFAQLEFVAAGKMAGFMRENADNFIGRLRLEQGARIDENTPAVDEGIEAVVVDQNDFDRVSGKTSGFDDRGRIVGDQRLDFGIPYDRHR